MQYSKLFAVDPSLSCSGWALFDVPRKRLLGVGKIRSLPSTYSTGRRFSDLQGKVSRCLAEMSLGDADVLICEAQTTMKDPHAAFKVEQVRGIFETLGRERGMLVPGRINPRSVQKEVMGLAGKQLPRTEVKSVAIEVAKNLFSRELKSIGFDMSGPALRRHQDIVDALLIGNLGLARLEAAITARMSLEDLFEAMMQSPRKVRSRAQW